MISDNPVTGDNIYLRELQNFFFEVLGMMSITHYGAVGDGRKDNYGALQVAIDDANRRGLSFLYVPYGRFIYTGELQNIGDITFMGNPHAHIVNIRTGEEIEIHQFGCFWKEMNEYYTKQEADDRYVNIAGDTMTGSLAVGGDNTITGTTSFAAGTLNKATGNYSVAEGNLSTASGEASHAEGFDTKATGENSHAEGFYTTASGESAHAEGSNTTASGVFSHVEGSRNVASGIEAHAEGLATTASGNRSHAEGWNTKAIGSDSHAEGRDSEATGYCSHAHGLGTKSTRHSQTAIGIGNIAEEGEPNNKEQTTSVFVVGNGSVTTDESGMWHADVPSNALRLTYAGDLYIAGTLNSNGADYAEVFEWEDGNENEEDRVGKFATITGNKIRLATSQDQKELLGVISAFPSVLGDSFDGYWHGKYVTDIYGRIQTEVVNGIEQPVISPDFDRNAEYIPRARRPEFGKLALLGKVVVEDDGTCVVGGYCLPNNSSIGTASNTGFYVMERIDSTHIRILIR